MMDLVRGGDAVIIWLAAWCGGGGGDDVGTLCSMFVLWHQHHFLVVGLNTIVHIKYIVIIRGVLKSKYEFLHGKEKFRLDNNNNKNNNEETLGRL